MDILMFIAVFAILALGLPSSASGMEAKNKQTCFTETFQPRCPYSQNIFIIQARYGHIEASRCVADDFKKIGRFGCFSDVRDIVTQRCGGKQRCEISLPDTEIGATKTCLTGLPMYLDVTYICLPELVSHISCNEVTVNRQKQYLLSDQVWDAGCSSADGAGVKQVILTADTNLNIKLTFSKIQVPGNETNTEDTLYVSDGEERLNIPQPNEQGNSIITTENNVAHINIHGRQRSETYLIGFQASGCDGLKPIPFTWMRRKNDITIIGCKNNDYEWTLECVGNQWVGSTGNCTKEVAVVTPPKPSSNYDTISSEDKKPALSKEVLFATIIGVTLLMCVIVITIGCVCLKRAKYSTNSVTKDQMELSGIMYDGDGTSSWSRKTISRNGQFNNENNQQNPWQNTLLGSSASQANGLVPNNVQKYYILDRDNVNSVNT